MQTPSPAAPALPTHPQVSVARASKGEHADGHGQKTGQIGGGAEPGPGKVGGKGQSQPRGREMRVKAGKEGREGGSQVKTWVLE